MRWLDIKPRSEFQYHEKKLAYKKCKIGAGVAQNVKYVKKMETGTVGRWMHWGKGWLARNVTGAEE